MFTSETTLRSIVGLADIILIAAVVYGISNFILKKSTPYPKFLTFAAATHLGLSMFNSVYYLCYGYIPDGMGITFFGYFGCYLFLFTANISGYDSIMDDQTAGMLKYKLISLAAPAVMLTLLLLYTVGNIEGVKASVNIITFIGSLPAAIASYYNMKFLIIPSFGLPYFKYLRVCNLFALLIELFDLLHAYAFYFPTIYNNLISDLFTLLLSCFFLFMLIFAQKGEKAWSV